MMIAWDTVYSQEELDAGHPTDDEERFYYSYNMRAPLDPDRARKAEEYLSAEFTRLNEKYYADADRIRAQARERFYNGEPG